MPGSLSNHSGCVSSNHTYSGLFYLNQEDSSPDGVFRFSPPGTTVSSFPSMPLMPTVTLENDEEASSHSAT